MNNFGLNDDLRYYEIELDSLDALNSAGPNSASTDWPLFYLGGKENLRDIAAIKIIEAQIPFSWYVFNSGNNTFLLTETGGSATVTLPIGNYTAAQLATLMGTALTAASPGSYTYTVVFNGPTQTFSFYNNAVSTSPFSFTFGLPTNSGNVNPRLYIGFPGGVTSSQSFVMTGTPAGNLLVSPNASLVTGPNYVYVNSAKIGQLTNIYLPKGAFNLGGGNSGPQMAKIPVNVLPGGVTFWQDPDPQKWFDVENLQQLDQIDFFLTLGNTTTQVPLQLNGLSFSLKLGVLLNKQNHNDVTGLHGRVVKRMRP